MLQRITNFAGEIPHMIPRLLGDNYAQNAYNVRLNDGSLRPINVPRFIHSLEGGPFRTIFKLTDENTWLAFPESNVHIARGPVAQNRLYITGTSDRKPKLRVDGVTVNLALAPPANAPVATLAGTLDTDNVQDIGYAYTYITEWDEESAPSPLSSLIKWSEGQPVDITGFVPPEDADRHIVKMRLYRSQTDTTGSTALFYLAERNLSVDMWRDTPYTTGETIPSTNYNAAPDGLSGVITLPNGLMVGFIQDTNILCFAEPWKPSAWPETYQLTTDFPIVGLGAFANTIVVLTTGKPYLVEGTAPDNMVMTRMDVLQPCVSPTSIVDLGYCVTYSSPDGIVTVSSSGVSVATSKLMTKEQWESIGATSIVAANYAGKYLASFSNSQNSGCCIFDFTGSQPFLSRTDYVNAYFYDEEAGLLYMLMNGSDIYLFDPVDGTPSELVWKSKEFRFSGGLNFGCIKIEADMLYPGNGSDADLAAIEAANKALFEQWVSYGNPQGPQIASSPLGFQPLGGSLVLEALDSPAPPIDTGASGPASGDADNNHTTVNIYGDRQLIATVTDINKVCRLPAKSVYSIIELEVRTTSQISSISLASQPSEMKQ